jgi:HEAT repeat protein
MSIFIKKSPDVAKMKGKENIHGLVKALRYPKDPQVRADAAEALGVMIYDKNIIMALFGAMDEKNSEVRESIVFALGKMGELPGIKMCVDQLLHPDSVTHFNMLLKILDKLYPIEVIGTLADLLKDENETSGVRKMAAQALETIGIQPNSEVLENIAAKRN